MKNIGKSIEWDRMLDAVEDGAAARAVGALLDPVVAAAERGLGLGVATRTAIFGERRLPRRSLILSWFELMRRMAREERRTGEGAEDADFAAGDAKKNRDVDSAVGGVAKQHLDGSPTSDSFLSGVIPGSGSRSSEGTPVSGALSPGAWKVFAEDRMTSLERVDRHILFDAPDRVAVGPLLGFHTARAGGITVREYMTDGVAAARAARRTWDVYGGFDMMPFSFPMGYLFPFMPESHSRFCSDWRLPEGDELPRMMEHGRYPDYDTLMREGCFAVARAEGGRLMREFRSMLPQGAAFAVELKRLLPRADLFHPYAVGVINHPADLISMWIGFERFMMDCATDPVKIREACERLGPGLVELGEFTGRAVGARKILYGASRIAASWVSRRMFDALFAGTFLSQARQACGDGFQLVYHLDNDYTAFLDFFLELPRRGGFLHLDQTDMFRAKEVLHGHLCLMGNLHPGLMAAGSPSDVTTTCERLIKEVGAEGGFILANACETPIDTPVENLTAARAAVNRWGWY